MTYRPRHMAPSWQVPATPPAVRAGRWCIVIGLLLLAAVAGAALAAPYMVVAR